MLIRFLGFPSIQCMEWNRRWGISTKNNNPELVSYGKQAAQKLLQTKGSLHGARANVRELFLGWIEAEIYNEMLFGKLSP